MTPGNTVYLPRIGRSIVAAHGETVLQAALAAGISYPHGCRMGRCGACKSHLVSGEIDLLKHTPFSLTEEEKAEGLTLACRAVPLSDVTIGWLDGEDEFADIPAGRFDGVIAEAVDATHDIKLIRIRLDDRELFTFKAGQYVRLLYPDCSPRDYSIASRIDEDLIEFHIRHVPGGVTSGHIFANAKAGDPVVLVGPFGSSYLREKHCGPILGIAGGSGLAPVKAVVEAALATDRTTGRQRPIHVYFGARAERDLYMVDRFEELAVSHGNLSFVPVLSNEDHAQMRRGYVGSAVADDFDDLDGWKAYLAGPPAMIEATVPQLLARGIRTADIHADVFFTPER
ncbi:2Fe-2S iron-sulfur cluster binding domain-containing protein [Rhizobium rhizogenes]|uniref:Oxidoreductase n=2 Tax=Rhizobium/Agrobacterium group TaxID=227290 RepID=A0AB36EQ40_AGRTU|nr:MULTISPECIES: 2Fe-2S iron-sulfur cluster-binding protein [Rhizobium/Agrobacterium group]MDX8322809.1 2Fe-2S iron-sulfur cluster-binding protein [Agrobacterium tumefaciens]OCJ35665.1 oxidoreductase [Agrobacterium tumefaciens]TRA91207.1 2Fe-2S iron-sulfur cluster binding domain-containing protein [Rhizobium rhizogenes]